MRDIGRVAGLTGVLAGAMFVLSTIIGSASGHRRGVFESSGDYLFQIVLAAAFALTLVAIEGLHSLQRSSSRYGRIGAAGALITFIGYALIVVVTALALMIAEGSLQSIRLIGAAAVLLGSILLGVMTIRARVLPWWCGVLLIVALPLGDISDMVVGVGSEGVVFGMVWGLLGYAMLQRTRVGGTRLTRQ
jgi:uncharacterized membrane protein YvlD (DUF360 family)